jgi:hypothetical protein
MRARYALRRLLSCRSNSLEKGVLFVEPFIENCVDSLLSKHGVLSSRMLYQASVAELLGMSVETAYLEQQLVDARMDDVVPCVRTLDRHVIVGKVYINPAKVVVAKLVTFLERSLGLVMGVLHLITG